MNPLRLIDELGPRILSMHLNDVDKSRGPSEHDQLVARGTALGDPPGAHEP